MGRHNNLILAIGKPTSTIDKKSLGRLKRTGNVNKYATSILASLARYTIMGTEGLLA